MLEKTRGNHGLHFFCKCVCLRPNEDVETAKTKNFHEIASKKLCFFSAFGHCAAVLVSIERENGVIDSLSSCASPDSSGTTAPSRHIPGAQRTSSFL